MVADTHFGHERIIAYERRPFANVDEMDAAMVRLWNRVVGDEDIVWHLGDVAVCGAERTRELVRALRGRKYLVLGNHDLSRTPTFWKRAGFLEVFVGPVALPRFLLSHEPVVRLPDGLTNFHGHCHGRGSAAPGCVCVCVELTAYRPICLGSAKPVC